jgi:tetratricopeptide (TPR) repeat protein
MPDGYVISSLYSDSMFVLLPKLNKRIPHKAFTFLKVSEEIPSFYLFGNLLYIEDWATNFCYLMDMSGILVKKISMNDIELYDEDHIITSGKNAMVYFLNTRKEFLLNGQSASRMSNTNLLLLVNEMTDESKLYNIKNGELVINGAYDYMSNYNKMYSILSKGDKSAVLHLQQAKLVTDFNLTNEQAIEFIEKQPDFLELQKQEKIKYEELVKSGDESIAKKDYNTAILNYTEAKKLASDLTMINKKLADANELKLKYDEQQKAIDSKYNELIKKGDSLFAKKIYIEAVVKYREAYSVKPMEQYPKSQIKNCEQAIADEQKQIAAEKAYLDWMAKGNKFMTDKKYQEAINAYEKALTNKPNDPTPVSKIQECKDAMK